MKVIGKMAKEKESEFITIKVVIDMKGIGKIIKDVEKEHFIIIMAIEQWVIIVTIDQ